MKFFEALPIPTSLRVTSTSLSLCRAPCQILNKERRIDDAISDVGSWEVRVTASQLTHQLRANFPPIFNQGSHRSQMTGGFKHQTIFSQPPGHQDLSPHPSHHRKIQMNLAIFECPLLSETAQALRCLCAKIGSSNFSFSLTLTKLGVFIVRNHEMGLQTGKGTLREPTQLLLAAWIGFRRV